MDVCSLLFQGFAVGITNYFYYWSNIFAGVDFFKKIKSVIIFLQ